MLVPLTGVHNLGGVVQIIDRHGLAQWRQGRVLEALQVIDGRAVKRRPSNSLILEAGNILIVSYLRSQTPCVLRQRRRTVDPVRTIGNIRAAREVIAVHVGASVVI